MWSVRSYFGIFFFSFFFSVLFCVGCCLVDSLLGFWVFLELCGLSLIPSFFFNSKVGVHGFYGCLLNYVIMSGLSSVLMVCGLLFGGLYYFLFIGFIVKFGLFPFSLWVYRVFSDSGWMFIFFLSVILKFPVLFFCFLFQINVLSLVYVDCFLTIMVCGLLFWFFSPSWEYVWCHISLSSVSTLVVSCFCSEVWVCLFIYFYYFIWASFCIIYFCLVGSYWSFNGRFWWYCFLLLVTPVSFPLFYKLGVCFAIFYSSFYVLFGWCIYSFSEQFFLFKLGGDYFYSEIYNNWSG
nr:NADH dehydrogenase subunit 2 [Raillietina sp. HL-2022]